MVGSTESSLIWRTKVTPRGGSISRLAPWTPPTFVSASTGSPWSSPNVVDSTGRGYMRANGKVYLCLPGQMDPEKLDGVAGWPTPAAADLSGGRTNPAGTSATGQRPDGTKAQVGLPNTMKATWGTPVANPANGTPEDFLRRKMESVARGSQMGVSLSDVAMQMIAASTKSTPRASDGEKGGPNQSFGADGQPLPAQMHGSNRHAFWGTPEASDVAKHSEVPATVERRIQKGQQIALNAHVSLTVARLSGPAPAGSSATTARPAGSPNPAFPCWLMGFPPVWLSGADSAMQSFRSSRRK